MEFKSISYGNSTIEFRLSRKDRKTLGIKVYPDGLTEVSAPIDADYKDIISKVKSKAQWIDKQKDFFMLFEPKTSRKIYESGESHLYLGRRYRLKVIESKNTSVKLKGGYIQVKTKDKSNKLGIETQLNNWYYQHASIHFNHLYSQRLGLAKELSDKETKLSFKWFSNRWGSCFKNGQITLNIELIKAPKECIDYVIVHEMCHLVHHNHSNKFYALLNKKLPNWKESKLKLEQLLA